MNAKRIAAMCPVLPLSATELGGVHDGFSGMAAPPSPPLPTGPLNLSLIQWRDLLIDVSREADRDNLGLVAAGVAFFALMAVFPALTAIVSLYGLLGDRAQVADVISSLRGIVPAEVLSVAHGQLISILKVENSALALSGAISVAISLWSALQGMRAFLRGLTIVYGGSRRRKFIQRYVAGVVLLLLGVLVTLLMLALFTVLPALFGLTRIPADVALLVQVMRWPVLIVAVTAFAMTLYRWGPHRKPPAWKWIWPGAVAASLVWLLASAAFSALIPHMSRIGQVYGAATGIVVLLLWFYMSALVFLLGGELNAELERCCAAPSEKGANQ